MSKDLRFVTDSKRPVNARRIPEEEWEQHKDEIVKLYQDHTVDDVRRLMEERYNLHATKRQFIHRLVDKWGVTKYNRKRTDEGSPHAAGPSSAPNRRSRSKSPPREPWERPISSLKRPPQPTAEEVEDDDASFHHLGRFLTADSPWDPIRSTDTFRVAVLDTGQPPDEIRPTLRDAGDDRPVHRDVTQPPVSPLAFPTHGPSRPRVVILDSGIRSASRDTDSGQTTRSSDRFGCPYRKRNPLRFNVRDYHSCASQPYPDISQLKRHVKVFHKRRHVKRCPRCKEGFTTKEEVDRHLLVPSDRICDVKALPPADPEDGIDDSIEDCLNGRKINTKIDSWESLWRLLFPDDAQPAEPAFYQVREHFELEQYLLQQIPESEAELGLRLLPMFESFRLTSLPSNAADIPRNQEPALLSKSVTPDPSLTIASSSGILSAQNKPKRRRVVDDDPGYRPNGATSRPTKRKV